MALPSPCGQCVILGCGIAGLAAAAALSRSYDSVIIIERDRLGHEPVPRRGVAQDRHLHNLLGRGQQSMNALLPGFTDALRAAGAGAAGVSHETHVHEVGRRMPERDLGLQLLSAPRPVMEHEARRLLLSRYDNVVLRDQTRPTAILVDGRDRVTGVRVAGTGRPEDVLSASLVIDASGAGSTIHQQFAPSFTAPAVTVSRPGQWYATRLFARPRHLIGVDHFWMVFATPPFSQGAIVAPLGNDRWTVSVSGRSSDTPPRDEHEFIRFVTELEDPMVAEVLSGARDLGGGHVFRKITARWRRYDHHARVPTGFLAIGDAVASLNPLYGQGVSVAAWQATALQGLVERCDLDPLQLTTLYHRQAAAICDSAWSLGRLIDEAVIGSADGEELAFKRSSFGARLFSEPALHRTYVMVWHLLEPVSTLAALLKGDVVLDGAITGGRPAQRIA